MVRPYSEDLRERVVWDVEAGASRRSVAAKYHVSVSFVVKLLRRWYLRGSVKPDRMGGRKPYALAAHGDLVRLLVVEQPDVTLEEMRARLAAEAVRVGRSSIARFLNAQRFSVKKKSARGRAGADRRGRRTTSLAPGATGT